MAEVPFPLHGLWVLITRMMEKHGKQCLKQISDRDWNGFGSINEAKPSARNLQD